MRKSLCAYVLALCLVLVSFPISAQESDLAAQWLVQVNRVRLDAGLAPYKRSNNLAAAAQRHADDVAAHGFADPGDVHLGSDGTYEQERVAETGYAAWTWNGGGLVVDENMATYDTIAASMEFFLGSAVHRNNILSSQYREIGIGVSTDDGGEYYHVLVFGVRPNVLPVFINDGAATTDDPNVAIRLTNEETRPDGEGADKMGQAIEVRIRDDREWDDQPWQPWDTYVPWTLPEMSGEHTVYVQFRDAAGRTAESADTIVLEGEGLAEPTPLPPTATSTPEPTETPVPPTVTSEPTAMPEPTNLPEPTGTFTPEPSPTVTLTPTPFESSPSTQAGGPTPFPTWTPLPTLEPPQPNKSQPPFYLLAALQGVVLLFGLYLVLRRGRAEESRDAPDTTA
ncbi:MAG: hypothetical protein JXA14_14975 [Anaerolineae bacterium]|nr:hypothetical protein [Anaerolineae bacterium]